MPVSTAFLSFADKFLNSSFRSTIIVKRFVGPDMGPKCLRRLSAWADNDNVLVTKVFHRGRTNLTREAIGPRGSVPAFVRKPTAT